MLRGSLVGVASSLMTGSVGVASGTIEGIVSMGSDGASMDGHGADISISFGDVSKMPSDSNRTISSSINNKSTISVFEGDEVAIKIQQYVNKYQLILTAAIIEQAFRKKKKKNFGFN